MVRKGTRAVERWADQIYSPLSEAGIKFTPHPQVRNSFIASAETPKKDTLRAVLKFKLAGWESNYRTHATSWVNGYRLDPHYRLTMPNERRLELFLIPVKDGIHILPLVDGRVSGASAMQKKLIEKLKGKI